MPDAKPLPEAQVAEAVRAQGYIDLDRMDDLADWIEQVVLPVITAMREQGWVVRPPLDR